MELSKEKSSLKQAESQTHQFLKTLGHVESRLSEQINYLTQVSTGIHIYHYILYFCISHHIFLYLHCLVIVYIIAVINRVLLIYIIGQPHEGSGYASQKVLQMAWHRLEHARSRVNELERIKNKLR
jgi:mediator of RNA polymerase II transcription subunit 11